MIVSCIVSLLMYYPVGLSSDSAFCESLGPSVCFWCCGCLWLPTGFPVVLLAFDSSMLLLVTTKLDLQGILSGLLVLPQPHPTPPQWQINVSLYLYQVQMIRGGGGKMHEWFSQHSQCIALTRWLGYMVGSVRLLPISHVFLHESFS